MNKINYGKFIDEINVGDYYVFLLRLKQETFRFEFKIYQVSVLTYLFYSTCIDNHGRVSSLPQNVVMDDYFEKSKIE